MYQLWDTRDIQRLSWNCPIANFKWSLDALPSSSDHSRFELVLVKSDSRWLSLFSLRIQPGLCWTDQVQSVHQVFICRSRSELCLSSMNSTISMITSFHLWGSPSHLLKRCGTSGNALILGTGRRAFLWPAQWTTMALSSWLGSMLWSIGTSGGGVGHAGCLSGIMLGGLDFGAIQPIGYWWPSRAWSSMGREGLYMNWLYRTYHVRKFESRGPGWSRFYSGKPWHLTRTASVGPGAASKIRQRPPPASWRPGISAAHTLRRRWRWTCCFFFEHHGWPPKVLYKFVHVPKHGPC